jgi:hypothetical protein
LPYFTVKIYVNQNRNGRGSVRDRALIVSNLTELSLDSAKRALASQVRGGEIGKKKGASYNVCEYEQPLDGAVLQRTREPCFA